MNRDQRQTTRFKSDYAADLARLEEQMKPNWSPLLPPDVRWVDVMKRCAEYRHHKSLVK